VEKSQLVNFIAKIMEESGFRVYKYFKTSQRIIDIYAVLPTVMGDFTIVVACKNYDKQWKVGLDIIKEMEMIGRSLKSSKVVIATSSSFSPQSISYASQKNIKLIDRDYLITLVKKFSKKHRQSYSEKSSYDNDEASSSSSSSSQELENSYDESYNDNQPLKPSNYTENNNSYKHDFKSTPSSQYHNTQYMNKSKPLNSKKRISSGVKKNSRLHPLKTKKGKNYSTKSSSRILDKREIEEPVEPLSTKIKAIFNNTLVLILLVVVITSLSSIIINNIVNIPVGVQGLVKIFFSLILSYGLVFIVNPKGTAVLLKGTIVFFVSLIISVLMIIFL
jgi:hypothetical protein